MVKSVAKWMNITLSFIREPDDNYGSWINNTWNGMIGMLYRNEVDIILNPILPKASILEFAYFTNPITVDAYTILSGKEIQEPGLFLYFKVLDTTVWLAMVITAVILGLTSTTVYRNVLMPKSFSWIRMTRQYSWHFLSYALRQNPTEKYLLRSNKARLSVLLPLLATLWILGIGLVMSSFQSLLVSKLTVRDSHPFVDSMDEFVNSHSTIGITPVEIQLGDVLENSSIPVYETAWKKIKDNLMPGGEVFKRKTIELVQKGKYCIFHGKIVLRNRLSHFYKKTTYCQFHLSDNHFFPFPLQVAVQRKMLLPDFDSFNLGITRLVDADLPGRNLKASVEVSNLCTSYSETKLRPLGLENIYGVLLMWVAGLCTGTVVLAIEIMCNKVR
ncbi:uncharacterized protein NPIL_693761 [Nephila pilipes]|uniref:Ionotropic glutamate receptor L-glutamate and glycine-binding domain-containing protein n=1 Tax=Nephila pilipes TaxID=299642 RepID=A0A8X6NTL3_NEPPI|nr:uncharacterized protein NPIL_693761 [Nephila pilipes]